MKPMKFISAIALAGAVAFMTSSVIAKERTKGRGAPGAPVIYVYSQGLYYDSIALGTLPYNGTDNFQKLEPGAGPMGSLATEFGPRDTEYYGGRWWIDSDENGEMDEDDIYFLCPLLGPGRPEA